MGETKSMAKKSKKNSQVFNEKKIFLHEFMVNGICNYLSPTEEERKNLYSFLFEIYELKDSPKIKILESSLDFYSFRPDEEEKLNYESFKTPIYF